ncbi:MAG: hypothetical protein KIT39_19840 [Nitrospirales bacterium]|nr:hypothetical protein [Nitrospirales bacterium]
MVFAGGVLHQIARSDPLSPMLSALGVLGLPGLRYRYLVCHRFSPADLRSLRYGAEKKLGRQEVWS